MVNSLLLNRLSITLNRAIEGIATLLLVLEEPSSPSLAEYKLQHTMRSPFYIPLPPTKRKLTFSSEKDIDSTTTTSTTTTTSSSSSSSSSSSYRRNRYKQQQKQRRRSSSPSSPVSIVDTEQMSLDIYLAANRNSLSPIERKRPRSPSTRHSYRQSSRRLLSIDQAKMNSLPPAGKRAIVDRSNTRKERPTNARVEVKKDIRAARKVNFATAVEYIP